jgi:hypothetical protein
MFDRNCEFLSLIKARRFSSINPNPGLRDLWDLRALLSPFRVEHRTEAAESDWARGAHSSFHLFSLTTVKDR